MTSNRANERVAEALYEARRQRLLSVPNAEEIARRALQLGASPLTAAWVDLFEDERQTYRAEAWPLTLAALGEEKR